MEIIQSKKGCHHFLTHYAPVNDLSFPAVRGSNEDHVVIFLQRDTMRVHFNEIYCAEWNGMIEVVVQNSSRNIQTRKALKKDSFREV